MSASGVWIYAQVSNGQVRSSSFELITVAKPIAEARGVPLTAVLLGSGCGDAANALTARGVDRALVGDNPALTHFADDAYTHALTEWIKADQPEFVFGSATLYGKALFPRVAALLSCGIVADARAAALDGGALVVNKPVCGGNAFSDVVFDDTRPMIVTMRPKTSPEAPESGGNGTVESRDVSLPDGVGIEILESTTAPAGTINLTEADIIVSGGRGIKDASNYHLIEELGAALGAATGASRAVVDAGWVPYEKQVGQTGKTVNPKMYIAAGISGAIQHLVGMQSSRVIVAINKDPDAPIHKVATYSIVGDLFDYVPAMTRHFKEQLGT